MTSELKNSGFIVSIVDKWPNWRQTIFGAIVVSIILGSVSFAYNTIQFPADKRQADAIEAKVVSMSRKDSIYAIERVIQLNIINNKITSTENAVCRMEEQMGKQGELLIKILSVTKGISLSNGYTLNNNIDSTLYKFN